MCTLSSKKTATGYRVYFNRDESVDRAKALAPVEKNGALMPIDAEKGGTWIGANRDGLVFCLLNNYQAAQRQAARAQLSQPETPVALKSRGEIIPRLSQCGSKAAVLEALNDFDFREYAAFNLVVFGESFSSFLVSPEGKGFRYQDYDDWPLTSSSYSEKVMAVRRQYFTSDLDAYHRSHLPEKGPYSVCVHRPDVETVSLTVVDVQDHSIHMSYFDGSPCESHVAIESQLLRDSHLQLVSESA